MRFDCVRLMRIPNVAVVASSSRVLGRVPLNLKHLEWRNVPYRCVATTSALPSLAAKWVVPRNADPGAKVGYYVAFPDIPDQTVENNTWLANIAENSDWPPLKSATPEEFYDGTIRYLLDWGANFADHIEMLEEDDKKKWTPVKRTFDNTMFSVLSELCEAHYATNTLLLKMSTDWPPSRLRDFLEDMQVVKKMYTLEAADRLFDSWMVDSTRKIYADKEEMAKLGPWERRYVEFVLNAADMQGHMENSLRDKRADKQEQINFEYLRWMYVDAGKFLGHITLDIHHAAKIKIPSTKMMADAPPNVLMTMECNGWHATTDPEVFSAVLKYCSNREIRSQLWENWVGRATHLSEDEHLFVNNEPVIEDLRWKTEGFVQSINYKTVNEHRLKYKMTGGTKCVREFLDSLIEQLRPVFLRQMDTWRHYADETETSPIGQPKPYDLFYLCRREAEHFYEIDTRDFLNHFPVWQTFEKLMKLTEAMLNIRFNDVTDSVELELFDPSIRVYAVIDKDGNDGKGEHLGRLYVDMFARESKSFGTWEAKLWRLSNKIRGLDKLVWMLGSVPSRDPLKDMEEARNNSLFTLLHYEELQRMLGAFGEALQLLISRSPYEVLTKPLPPFYSSELDAENFLAYFYKFFIYKPKLLIALSSPDVVSGDELTKHNVEDITSALRRSTFWETYRTLFWSDFDHTLWSTTDYRRLPWLDLYRELYSEYFPFGRAPNDYHPCSFAPIFGHPQKAGLYYARLWQEMLALDVHETFEREGDELSTGKRLKSAWLNHGCLETQQELYQKFQGRPPVMKAILEFHSPLDDYYTIDEIDSMETVANPKLASNSE